MVKIAYIEKKFRPEHLSIIATADEIMREYAADGYSITLRQLYYQFVARGFLGNTQQNYKRLGSIVNDARLAGKLDWDIMEDRTRNLEAIPHWTGPNSIIAGAAAGYQRDLWSGQDIRPEVWVEKEALVGVIGKPCEELRVDHFACRGYTSQSEQWIAAQRIIKRWKNSRQQTVILHFGDHDPSGIDMTRDNLERLRLFVQRHSSSCPVRVVRLALNMDQIEEYDPPPNPAKTTDARFEGYAAKYGDESWELDALDPKTIGQLVEDNVNLLLDSEGDRDLYNEIAAEEARERELLESASERWDEVAELLS